MTPLPTHAVLTICPWCKAVVEVRDDGRAVTVPAGHVCRERAA